MKHLLILGLLFLETACGSPPEKDYRKVATYSAGHKQTPLVTSADQLPACTPGKDNELVYVKEIDAYKVCLNNVWTDIDTSTEDTKNLEPSRPVAGVKQILGSDVDLCSGYMQIACFFDGGELITYADGSMKYKGRIVKKVVSQSPDDAGKVNSADVETHSMTHLQSWPSSSVMLVSDVTRNSVTSGVWLFFDAKANQFSLIFDTNQDNVISDGDELLFHPELADY